ncbi:ADP-ribosylation factor-directed GTPase activating protein isoform b [Allorhodopirellula solitaria]|nr:ADP-ribosylation factor-directed GTPase activating protein isoform b [Allorhodopirellula solitaria]
MMGCASPMLMGSTLPCAADEMEATQLDDLSLRAPVKVPSSQPTPTVHSVLGLQPGGYDDSVGSSIELLPPKNLPAKSQQAESTLRELPPRQVVTRDLPAGGSGKPDAVPVSNRRGVPAWIDVDEPYQGGEPTSGEWAVPETQSPQTSQSETSQLDTSQSDTSEPDHTDPVTGDRSQDAWQPRGQARQTQPLRDLPPILSAPQNSTADVDAGDAQSGSVKSEAESSSDQDGGSSSSATVGSGLPKLSPVVGMPSLEDLPAARRKLAKLPPIDELPDHADVDADAESGKRNAINPHDGNNEGDAVGVAEVTPDTAADTDTDAATEIAAQTDLDAEADAEAEAGLDASNSDRDDATTAEQPSLVRDDSRLSAIDIQPLVVDPVDAFPPAQDATGQPATQDDKFESKKESSELPSVSDEGLASEDAVPLDATGRVKSHDGIGAAAELSPDITRLQQPIEQTLRSFYGRTEKADSRSNWGMMHAIMVYGTDTRIIARRRNYSAIAWMAGNNVCRGNRLMTTEGGRLKIREGTGLQGHQAQWLAVLSLAEVPASYPLYADNRKFTIEDLVKIEAAACEEGKELTFSLIGLSHYLETNATWTGAHGETWDFERLIAAELDEPIVGAACGGTHRLMGFAHALRKRRLEGQPIEGQWKRAEQFLDDFVDYTYTLQNRDGSFSTDWFESRQDNGDVSRKVQTTGHMLEFLLTHLPDEEIVNRPVVSAVRFLTSAMRRVEIDDAGVGYRAHALRSLAMFHERAYGTLPAYSSGQMATGQHRRASRR